MRPCGPARFKNVAREVDVFELVPSASIGAPIDPVCRMRVEQSLAPARLPFAGRTFFFCSFDCARAFAANPERYAATFRRANRDAGCADSAMRGMREGSRDGRSAPHGRARARVTTS